LAQEFSWRPKALAQAPLASADAQYERAQAAVQVEEEAVNFVHASQDLTRRRKPSQWSSESTFCLVRRIATYGSRTVSVNMAIYHTWEE
jgi:hypothetical protein